MTCPTCKGVGTVPYLDCGQPYESLRCEVPCPAGCDASKTIEPPACPCGQRKDVA